MFPVVILLAQSASRTDAQLEQLRSGYLGIVLITLLGTFGLLMILALAALWRRSLKRQKRLERQIQEMRATAASMGDAWAAAARRVEVASPHPGDEAEDEEEEEDDDPYNLFGGRDPLEGTDEEDDPGFDDEDEDFEDEDPSGPGRPGDWR